MALAHHAEQVEPELAETLEQHAGRELLLAIVGIRFDLYSNKEERPTYVIRLDK